jgi:Phage integrase, N-terminal SAM-like domain
LSIPPKPGLRMDIHGFGKYHIINGKIKKPVFEIPAPTTHPMPPQPKLLDSLRARITLEHYSVQTEKTYAHWVGRFIPFHGKRDPEEMLAHGVVSPLDRRYDRDG